MEMINHKHKFIFIHIPKTAGTSVKQYLRSLGSHLDYYGHSKLGYYYSKYRNIDGFFKFSFIRNPWDMTTSMYRFLWKSSFPLPVTWRKNNPSFAKLSFTEWVKHPYFSNSACIRGLDVARPTGNDGLFGDWITHGKNKLNFIGRFENLQEDFDYICSEIGVPKSALSHLRKTSYKPYAQYYNDDTVEIVAKKYAKDIEFFRYEFGK